MSEFNDLYPMVFKNRCGHTTTITCSPDDAGQLVAEQSFELCAICDQAIWEQEHAAAIDAYERAMEENYLAEELPIMYRIDLFKTEEAVDPCFHCKNLGLDTPDNCGGCTDNVIDDDRDDLSMDIVPPVQNQDYLTDDIPF